MREWFQAQGIDPKSVKSARVVGGGGKDPLDMTRDEHKRARVGGRALDAADKWFVGFESHWKRVQSLEDDPDWRAVLAYEVDTEVCLVLLLRLRRAAVLLRDHVAGCEGLVEAVEAFDSSLPHLKHLRDTAEHFDDYARGEGYQEPKDGIGRQYKVPDSGAPVVRRYARALDLDEAIKAARDLYEEMYQVATCKPPALLDR